MDLTLSRLPGRSSPYDEIPSASSSSSVQRWAPHMVVQVTLLKPDFFLFLSWLDSFSNVILGSQTRSRVSVRTQVPSFLWYGSCLCLL
jgi:hypothetical protein